jgi:predicted transcriptional regulator
LLSLQKEREEYEVIVEKGKLVFRQDGRLVNTDEKSKWIFVLSTTRALYVGKKQKGKFQHSSFLAGGATTAAGRLVAHQGVLEVLISICTPHFYKDFIYSIIFHHYIYMRRTVIECICKKILP